MAPTWQLRLWVLLGTLAFIYYLGWWYREPGADSAVRLLLALALPYFLIQLPGSWFLYLIAHQHRDPPPAETKGDSLPTVDVFVTACGEPYALVKRALKAACAIRTPHRTWLLDDGADPALADLARGLGAGYLSRPSREDAKAGNLNAALQQTSGELVAIFDVDHVPRPDFLERVLPHFADSSVGFVQVMLTFGNQCQSWVARAAAETSLDYYVPTSLGMDAIAGTTLMGSNAVIRRAALDSIDGYRPGLAEDLATSLALHKAGWGSVYVPEPLAPGLAPSNVQAWLVQQLKWARGVFELLITAYPRSFFSLTNGQRLAYAVRMTKYWIGPVVMLHLVLTLVALLTPLMSRRYDFESYLIALFLLVVGDLCIKRASLQMWNHMATFNTYLWRATVLVFATWPVYTLAWFLALLRVPLSFRLTPKDADTTLDLRWICPHLLLILLLLLAIARPVTAPGASLDPIRLFAVAEFTVLLIFVAECFWDRSAGWGKTQPATAALDGYGAGPDATLSSQWSVGEHDVPDRPGISGPPRQP